MMVVKFHGVNVWGLARRIFTTPQTVVANHTPEYLTGHA
jgi:hypothetical protein